MSVLSVPYHSDGVEVKRGTRRFPNEGDLPACRKMIVAMKSPEIETANPFARTGVGKISAA